MELRVCDVEVGQDRGAVGSDRLPLRMPIGLAGIAVADVLVPGVVELAIVCGDITRWVPARIDGALVPIGGGGGGRALPSG